ncbi:hypothetical protein J3R83DRAFT_5495 [Lanmaoa asiatica]|nr:hypothetical protein J3R83DRAFT_5495 [Lanmaoa asiatica]
MRLHSRELPASEPQRPSSLVIDLTMDSGSDGEEAAPSNISQASQPSFEPLALSQSWPPQAGKFLRNLTPSLNPIKFPTNAPFFTGPQSKFHSITGTITSITGVTFTTSSPIATPPGCITSVVPQPTFDTFGRSGLSLPPQSDNTHIPSGTYGSPIVIEDSETEN